MSGCSGNCSFRLTRRSSSPSGAMFHPMSVYGPSCGRNSTSSSPGHGDPPTSLWPSLRTFSPAPSHVRTVTVE